MIASLADRPDLSGVSILVVEDEYYLAAEMQTAIEEVGGAVVGPCADAEAGLAALEGKGADYALVDINLGTGPSFEMADALRAKRIPFLFLTGYDANIIPDRFSDIRRIEKPADFAALLRTIDLMRR